MSQELIGIDVMWYDGREERQQSAIKRLQDKWRERGMSEKENVENHNGKKNP